LVIGSATPALLLGMAIASHHSSPKPTHVALNKISITQPSKQAKSTVAVETTPNAPATLGSSTTTAPTDTTSNQPTTTATSHIPQNIQTPPSEPQPPAPVVAVSATLSDWKYLGDVINVCVGVNSGGCSNSQGQYCIYTYSDNSTKQRLYATRGIFQNGTIFNYQLVQPTLDCSISTAP